MVKYPQNEYVQMSETIDGGNNGMERQGKKEESPVGRKYQIWMKMRLHKKIHGRLEKHLRQLYWYSWNLCFVSYGQGGSSWSKCDWGEQLSGHS